MPTFAPIAVIGAGLAGLSCATALRQAGHEVMVFDKSRGVGGRMSTRRGDDWSCDHGAQYFTARHPLFQQEVARWQAAGAAALWTPRLRVLGTLASADEHHTDHELQRFVGLPGMTAPARWLAATLPVQLQTHIQQLTRDKSGWCLHSEAHGALAPRFCAVVLALPAVQARPLLQPVTPALAELSATAVMRACWALMLRFEQPVALDFDAAFVNHGPLRWIARNTSKPGRQGRESWLLHASPSWSEAHVDDSPEQVAAALIAAFHALGGPTPEAWSAHRWRYADTAPALTQQYAWQADIGLGLCGDWINGGKVEGAWLSGFQLAQAIGGKR